MQLTDILVIHGQASHCTKEHVYLVTFRKRFLERIPPHRGCWSPACLGWVVSRCSRTINRTLAKAPPNFASLVEEMHSIGVKIPKRERWRETRDGAPSQSQRTSTSRWTQVQAHMRHGGGGQVPNRPPPFNVPTFAATFFPKYR